VPKRRELTNKGRVALIRSLAGNAAVVRPTKRASKDMVRLGLTKADVCEAVCTYINCGSPVMETITDTAHGHLGEPAYEVYPTIHAEDRFVKVAIDQYPSGPVLILVSVHER